MPVHVGAGSSAIQIQSPLGEDPSSGASAGDLYYNTTDNAYKYYDGSRWKKISSETGYDGGIGNDPHYNNVSLHLKASDGILSDVNKKFFLLVADFLRIGLLYGFFTESLKLL